ncbi:hypothetical protein RHMOL_Rhmol06G0279400 [Rhododendron molle]|uniref:Uncharacterized protein n=1 Tax=Rhododendron molle TaxID=49168 RepID=A0ACC0NGX0_RHOML|nr:hypothetical protein RHMOL_Rhmol06G0279400 [Rhododendron molle]
MGMGHRSLGEMVPWPMLSPQLMGGFTIIQTVRFFVSQVAGSFHLETVALHEIGHLLELGHNNVQAAVMWTSIPAATSKVEKLIPENRMEKVVGTNITKRNLMLHWPDGGIGLRDKQKSVKIVT